MPWKNIAGLNDPIIASTLFLLLLWDLIWKGLALWRAAKRRERWWFIALLVVNTAGLLPIAYLLLKPDVKRKSP